MFSSGRSHRDDRRTATAWRRQAFTLVALAAVFLQTFVVQTHVHTPLAPLPISYSQPAGDDAHSSAVHAIASNAHHQLVCALCHVLASAGAAVLPSTAIVLHAAQTNIEAIVALARAPRVHTHSWQSRAPPSFL
jgi:hypothetical protein